MKKKIVVMGYMFRCPIGGVIWQHLHYIVGFQRLGFKVSYFEDASKWPSDVQSSADESTHNVEIAQKLADQYSYEWGFRASYRNPPVTYGCDAKRFSEAIEMADAVFNICGIQAPIPEFKKVNCLVYVESDPGLEQIKLAKGNEKTIRGLKTHHFHFTFGENIARSSSPIPSFDEIRWIPTRQPVVLDFWKNHPLPETVDQLRFTTITSWKAQGKDVEWENDMYYWSKHFEFLKFCQVPEVVQASVPITWELSVGVNGPPADKEKMETHGWILKTPKIISEDPFLYRDYISNSDGEWTIAKDQYTRLNTGWFSDRSVCYLAASRPVITQETGFSDVVPQGEGLFAFRNISDIQAAVDKILTNPRKQSDAALAIAHEYFDAEKICGEMVQKIGI